MVRRFHNHREESIQTKLPVHYDLFASHLSCLNSVLNVKVIVDTFNHNKFLVGALSMIVWSSTCCRPVVPADHQGAVAPELQVLGLARVVAVVVGGEHGLARGAGRLPVVDRELLQLDAAPHLRVEAVPGAEPGIRHADLVNLREV